MVTMRKMHHLLTVILCSLLAVMMVASCQRDPLEKYYSGKGEITIVPDWDTLFVRDAADRSNLTGMTVVFSKSDTSAVISPYPDITNTVNKYETELAPGKYNFMVFNLSPTEFGSMNFYQMKDFKESFVVGLPLQRTTEFWDVNANYIKTPEYIGCAVDSLEVLPGMYDGEVRFVDYKTDVTDLRDIVTKRAVIKPMTAEMVIRVKVLGYKYMKSVIGNISGMANGFMLSQAWRRSQTCYQLLDNWTAKAAPEESDSLHSVGYISTRISTFGLPHGRELLSQRDSTSNLLTLCFTLVNGKQHSFTYSVGKDIKYKDAELDISSGDQPLDPKETDGSSTDGSKSFNQTDVALELELLIETPFFTDDYVPNLPYAQPTGTGTFDAEVEDWGEDVDVKVPI